MGPQSLFVGSANALNNDEMCIAEHLQCKITVAISKARNTRVLTMHNLAQIIIQWTIASSVTTHHPTTSANY